MKVRLVGIVCALFVASCGESAPTIADRIDAIRSGGQAAVYGHMSTPSRERLKELFPERAEDPDAPWKRGGDRAAHNPDARAILDAGRQAVPDLVALVDDPERRALAAYFLIEAGGEDAATALLGEWRELREQRTRKSVDLPQSDGTRLSAGYRVEGVDSEFYREVLNGLKLIGKPVAAAVAADVAAAMEEVQRRLTAGEELTRSETTDEIETRWSIRPAETACEGIEIVALCGSSESDGVLASAIGTGVHPFVWTALSYASWVDPGNQDLAHAAAGCLDNPRWREPAVIALAWLLDRKVVMEGQSEDELEVLANQYRKRLAR